MKLNNALRSENKVTNNTFTPVHDGRLELLLVKKLKIFRNLSTSRDRNSIPFAPRRYILTNTML